ncbi:MAG: NADH-quinone oxidoreductase subunit A [Armatimonadetes bacterium]|nr:NADH-quinone oxidoreductase subunit A [Armatimonadota bacterium]MDW8121965.1 NADH-quinone oxidoreductase subunit A [Armatimonadota bacterium]
MAQQLPYSPSDYLYVAVFAVTGTLLILLTLVLAWIFRPYRPTKTKTATYECSVIPRGSAWIQFRIIYYLFALLFVIFGVEALFLFPWGAALNWLKDHGLGLVAFVDMLIFLLILAFGWLYAWRKGILRWA